MSEEMVMDLMQRMMSLAAVVSLPLLGVGIAVGLLVAIFMAATQIQEASLNFVPKIFAIGATLLIVGPWMLDSLVAFARAMLTEIVTLGPGV